MNKKMSNALEKSDYAFSRLIDLRNTACDYFGLVLRPWN